MFCVFSFWALGMYNRTLGQLQKTDVCRWTSLGLGNFEHLGNILGCKSLHILQGFHFRIVPVYIYIIYIYMYNIYIYMCVCVCVFSSKPMFPKSPKWLFGHLGTFQSSDSSVNPQGFKMGRPFSCIFLASWSCLCAQYRPWLRTFNSTLHSGNGDSGATDTFLVARCAGECWIRARDLCREITGVSMSPLLGGP